jgi:hypothetical protein
MRLKITPFRNINNNTTQHDFFRELDSAANYDSILIFSPARQGSEIIHNISSKNTKNALIESLQKDTTKYFL